MFGGVSPLVQMSPESLHIKCVELLHLLLALKAKASSHPLYPMAGEEVMHSWHNGKTLGTKSPLDYQSSSQDPLVVEKLRIHVYLVLALNTQPVGLISNWCKDVGQGFWSIICTFSLI